MLNRIPKVIVVLLLAAVVEVNGNGQDKPATPAEEFRVLLKERDQLPDAVAKAKTPEERKELQARLASLPRRFLELAEKNPKDPVAVEALTQTIAWVNGSAFPVGGKDTPGERALALLARDHVTSDKLGLVCRHVLFGFHKSHETLLRTVLDKNPHREVQGLACLSLAQFLNDRLHRLEILAAQEKPDLAERYHRVFGKEFVEELQRQDRAAVAKEAETLFDRAADKYGDVKIPVTYFGSGGTVGKEAAEELFQIRNLAVGKEAPEIAGEDQDGKKFKISDYRGKVVLLDFWHHL